MNWSRIVRELTAAAQLARIKTVCAWCGKLICDGALIDGKASHGICRTCEREFRKKEGL